MYGDLCIYMCVCVCVCVHFKNLGKCHKLMIMVIWVKKNRIISLHTSLYCFIGLCLAFKFKMRFPSLQNSCVLSACTLTSVSS